MENATGGWAVFRNTCNFGQFMMTTIFQRFPEMGVAGGGGVRFDGRVVEVKFEEPLQK